MTESRNPLIIVYDIVISSQSKTDEKKSMCYDIDLELVSQCSGSVISSSWQSSGVDSELLIYTVHCKDFCTRFT